jgi:hypothetical protein
MHLRKIHLWKIRHQQSARMVPVFLTQTYQGRSAYILRALYRNEKRDGLNASGGLTQENKVHRLALLNLAQVVGIFLETFHCRKVERTMSRPQRRQMNNCRRTWVRSGDPIPTPGRAVEAPSVTDAGIPGSARYEHDNKRENTGGNPPSGHEKPEMPRLVLFTPRNRDDKAKPSGADANMEIKSWNCACN